MGLINRKEKKCEYVITVKIEWCVYKQKKEEKRKKREKREKEKKKKQEKQTHIAIVLPWPSLFSIRF